MKKVATSVQFAIVISTAGISILSAQTVQAQQNFSQTTAHIQILKKQPVKIEQTAKNNEVFTPVTTEPVFQGGGQAWMQFLKENLSYPEEAIALNIWGDVEVEFTVDKDGSVKNVRSIAGDQELQAEAERIIMLSSGMWKPAHQNGYDITFRQKQKINFHLTVPE